MVDGLINTIGLDLWSVIKAVVLLIVAFLVAWIVKKVVTLILEKTVLRKLFSKTEDEGVKAIGFIAKLIQIVIFLLFVPGIFNLLGVQGVADPINGFLQVIWTFLPNIIGAIIVVRIGFFIAKIVKELLEAALAKVKLNKLQDLAGIETSEQNRLSKTVAYIVYVLILIPVFISALQILNIEAISAPATEMLMRIITFIPFIFVAVIIIVIGSKIAQFCGRIVERLIGAAGLDEKLNSLIEDEKKQFSLSKICGIVVMVLLNVFFVVQAINVLQLEVLTNIGNAVISYIPYIFAAAIILVGCFIVESLITRILKKNGRDGLAVVASAIVYVVGIFMILSELQIAPIIVNSAFVVLIAAVGVAVAIAFGVGGRDFAKNMLKHLEEQLTKKKD